MLSWIFESSWPGLYLTIIWFLFITSLWAMFELENSQLFCSAPVVMKLQDGQMVISLDSAAWIFAAWGFFSSAVVNLMSTFLRPIRKLQQCSSIAVYIEVVALTTYTCLLLRVFPDIKNMDGAAFDWLHFVEWSFTTPILILMMGALGTSTEKGLVNNWPLVSRAMLLDEGMIVTGFASQFFAGPLRWCFLAVSFAFLALLFRAMRCIIAAASTNASSLLEVRVLHMLELFTLITWSGLASCRCRGTRGRG